MKQSLFDNLLPNLQIIFSKILFLRQSKNRRFLPIIFDVEIYALI